MLDKLNELTKKLGWVDMKLVAVIGVCIGILLAKTGCLEGLNHWWPIGVGLACYGKVLWSLLLKK